MIIITRITDKMCTEIILWLYFDHSTIRRPNLSFIMETSKYYGTFTYHMQG